MTAARPSTPPRRRHLMDPNAPRPKRDPEAIARLQKVQRRVVSVLIMTTIAHLTAGMIVAAVLDVGGDQPVAKVGLVVIGTIFWAIGVIAVRVINRVKPMTWWQLTSLAPLVVGLWLAFR